MSSSRVFFQHYMDAAIVRMIAGDDANRSEAWGVILEGLQKPKHNFIIKELRYRGAVDRNLSADRVTCEEVYLQINDYVFDHVLTQEKLDIAFASYDLQKGSLRSYLMNRIVFAVGDWFKVNFKRHQQDNRRRTGVDVSLSTSAAAESAEDSESRASREMDEHIHALTDTAQAAFSLKVHPIYSLSTESRNVVHEQAALSGQKVEETDHRINELERVAGEKAATQRESADDRLEAAWSDVQRLQMEVERRESRMLVGGMPPAQVEQLRASAAQTGLVREVEVRYAGVAADEPFVHDRAELECDLVRLRQARERHSKLQEGGPVTATSNCIRGCLNWTRNKVDLALNRAKKKLRETLGPILGIE